MKFSLITRKRNSIKPVLPQGLKPQVIVPYSLRLEPLVNNLRVPEHRGGEEQRVNAVQHAAMAGKQGAGVLDAGRALECGLSQIARLCCHVDHYGQRQPILDAFWIREAGRIPHPQ